MDEYWRNERAEYQDGGPADEADEALALAEYYAELDALAAAGPAGDDDMPW
jgi:hypothetical protein